MQCPQCGAKKLRINVIFAGSVACEFRSDDRFELCETASIDSYWHDDSGCSCIRCGWSGLVRDIRQAASLGGETENSVDLDQLRHDLDVGNCPPHITGPVQQLIETVQTLRMEVGLLERINKSLRKNSDSSCGDTHLF